MTFGLVVRHIYLKMLRIFKKKEHTEIGSVIIDILFMGLNVAWSVLILLELDSDNFAYKELIHVLSVASNLVFFVRTCNVIRLHNDISPLIDIIYKVLTDIYWFILVLCLACLVLAMSFYSLA